MAHDHGVEGNKKQSEISPAAIKKLEKLLLAVVDPLNWADEDFTKNAFQTSKLKATQLSVARLSYASPKRIDYFVYRPILKKDPTRVVKGVMSFTCGDLCAPIPGSDDGEFVVLDAPSVLDGKIYFAHAHIGFSRSVIDAGKNAQTAAVCNLKLLVRKGAPVAADTLFPPVPLIYLRPSELRLSIHRIRLWATGEGQRFISQNSPALS
ncbi:hypothetical protein Q3O97_11445 [Ralstonia pseudosolanacearum]|uniref:hypothetical protein n=1 Tax=Ralstonia pseudosolanacearum TaxID=1310165 RepID=UPI00270300B1|nr:hypothetical protein [Ralstonia pseudosolanacearum]MDO3616465.1 hypothetical protein [Ralstonia pseudosolanacearum]